MLNKMWSTLLHFDNKYYNNLQGSNLEFSDSSDFPLEHGGVGKTDLWIPAHSPSLPIPNCCPNVRGLKSQV